MWRTIGRTWRLALLARDLLAARWRRASLSSSQGASQAAQLADRLAGLHGLPQKIGQLLALTEGGSDYQPLLEGPGDRSWDELAPLVEASLGRPWRECFREVEPAGVSASLAQVHRATLPDGRVVAVKVQHPRAAADARADLRAVSLLTLPFGGLGRGFDTNSYRQEIGDKLGAELDYRREAEALTRFGARARGRTDLLVPDLIPELCSDRVLTMTWLGGEPLTGARTWPEADRAAAGRTLVRVFLESCFVWGELHADPHPGNYRFQRGPDAGGRGGVSVGLLDFGCVLPLDHATRSALRHLIDGARQPAPPEVSVPSVLAGYEALGFNGQLLAPLADRLPALTALLAEPFVRPGPFDMTGWRLTSRAAVLLGEFRGNVRFAAPARLLFFVRAYIGLIRHLAALGAPVDWSALWDELLSRLAPVPGLLGAAPTQEPPMKSRHLRLRVEQDGQLRVELTFKAGATALLADLVPEELAENLQRRGIDVARIAAETVAAGCPPGELFRLHEAGKLVRVWLE